MTRDSFELLEGFINIGFCAFVEVRVVNVVGVVSSFFFDLRAADFGAMISSSGDDNRFGSEAYNHGDLIRAGAFGNVNFAGDTASCAVGGNSHAGVAAGVLNAFFNADGFHMAYQGSCSAVLKGERRHHEIHLEEDASVVGSDGRHAFSHGNSAPNITVQIHKSVVTELRPNRFIN